MSTNKFLKETLSEMGAKVTDRSQRKYHQRVRAAISAATAKHHVTEAELREAHCFTAVRWSTLCTDISEVQRTEMENFAAALDVKASYLVMGTAGSTVYEAIVPRAFGFLDRQDARRNQR